MKIFWILLAILLTCLAIGGLMSFTKRGDWFDLGITALIAWGAVGSWKRARS
jgi:hypothetical protein